MDARAEPWLPLRNGECIETGSLLQVPLSKKQGFLGREGSSTLRNACLPGVIGIRGTMIRTDPRSSSTPLSSNCIEHEGGQGEYRAVGGRALRFQRGHPSDTTSTFVL